MSNKNVLTEHFIQIKQILVINKIYNDRSSIMLRVAYQFVCFDPYSCRKLGKMPIILFAHHSQIQCLTLGSSRLHC